MRRVAPPSSATNDRSFLASREARVDWYEAFAEVLGERRKLYCFAMRRRPLGSTGEIRSELALWHKGFAFGHAQFLLATTDVMTHGRFRHCDLRFFPANPLPDAVRRVALLAWGVLASSQNLVNNSIRCAQLGLGSGRSFAFRRDRARQCLPHNPPMYPKLFRHSPDRSYAKAMFPPDLFKQFHLAHPVHCLPVLAGQNRVGCANRYI